MTSTVKHKDRNYPTAFQYLAPAEDDLDGLFGWVWWLRMHWYREESLERLHCFMKPDGNVNPKAQAIQLSQGGCIATLGSFEEVSPEMVNAHDVTKCETAWSRRDLVAKDPDT